MGCESDALWQLDSKESGLEKAYCCIASNARDFARLGNSIEIMESGTGKQLLDSTFCWRLPYNRAFAESPEYGYGWWLLDYKDTPFLYDARTFGTIRNCKSY